MMSSQEIKPEPLGEVEGAFEHLNERAEDFSNIVFDYEDPVPDQDKIPIKEEIKEEIKHEPMDIDNRDDDSHVIDVEKDQEKSYLQSMIDKLLIEKHTLQKDIDKLVELQVENQILKSDKTVVERQLKEKEKEFQDLSLHCAQLQSTILNSKENKINNSKKLNKSDITQNMEISELNEEEPTVFQAEEFNLSDHMASSNCSDSGTTQITFEQSTIPYSDNDSPEENKKKEEAWLHLTDTSDGEEDEDHFNKKSKSKEHFTINRKRMPRSTRKDIRYDTSGKVKSIRSANSKTVSASTSPKTISDEKSTSNVPIYCLCREPERPSMIGCDYCDEWYHISCLNLSKDEVKELTKCKWMCPKCELKDNKLAKESPTTTLVSSSNDTKPPEVNDESEGRSSQSAQRNKKKGSTLSTYSSSSDSSSSSSSSSSSTSSNTSSNMDNSHQNRRRVLKKTNSKVTPHKKNHVKRKQDQNLQDLNKIADENGNVPCPECGKMLKISSLKTHIEDRHTDSPGYSCALCGSVCRSRNSLNSHMSRSHRGIKSKDVPMNPIEKLNERLNAIMKKMIKKQKKKC